MGVRRPVPDPDAPRRPPTGAPAARGVQRAALDRAGGGAGADAADEPAAVAHRLPADAALDRGRRVRGHRARPASAAARGARSRPGAPRGDPGWPDAAIEPGEWGAG